MLFEDKIPVHDDMKQAAFKFEIDPTACALSGGEDYELVFTLPATEHEKLVLNEQISVIGYMTDPELGRKIVTKSGNSYPITAQGWNAFKQG